MNKKIIDYLESIDLSEQEAQLYLLLIESGPVSVKELATKAGIKRTTTYLYLDQLIEKGLVMKIVKGTNKLVAAVDPEISLQKLVKDKLSTALHIEKQFPTIIERIHDVIPKQVEVGEAEIKYYKGSNNARKIYLEALASKELRSYIRIDKKQPLFSPNNINVFCNALKNNKDLKIWEIIYDEYNSDTPSSKLIAFKNRYNYKYMSKGQKINSEDILMFDGKVAIINFRNDETSIVISTPDIYNNFKEIFDYIWKTL